MLAIDPGPTESAYVEYDRMNVKAFGKVPNDEMLIRVIDEPGGVLVIEQVASYGMPVGAEVFETVFWSGRFAQAFAGVVERLPRHEVKMRLCHNTRGVNDSVIRQRVIDLFGGKDAAIGRKKTPGPLYGVTSDVWQALALAVAFELGGPIERKAVPQ